MQKFTLWQHYEVIFFIIVFIDETNFCIFFENVTIMNKRISTSDYSKQNHWQNAKCTI